MRTRDLHPVERAPRGKGQLREGLRYVAGRPELIWPIVLVGFIGTFGFNFPIWLSAFADDVFHADAGTYGLLQHPDGGRLGRRRAARRPPRHRPAAAAGRRRRWPSACWRSLAAAGARRSGCSPLLMVPIGIFGLTVNVTANTSVQMATDPAMRGRVMSPVHDGLRRRHPAGRARSSAGSPTPTAPASASPSGGAISPPPRSRSAWSWPARAACG